MSTFFTLPASERKRKREAKDDAAGQKRSRTSNGARARVVKVKQSERDESISSSGSEDDGANRVRSSGPYAESDTSDSEGETGAEKRLRLAEAYLQKVSGEVELEGADAEELDRELIAKRLKEDVAETKGRVYRYVANGYDFTAASKTFFYNTCHTTTSIATCRPYAYTVSKGLSLIKWELPNPSRGIEIKKNGERASRPLRRRPTKLVHTRGSHQEKGNQSYQHHTDPILCVAASQDDRFVATGGADKRLIIWNAMDLKPLRVFAQHRDAITGLAFRRGTNQLYSCSADRTIKIWSLNELAYVETLFGHQDVVMDVSALAQERCISVGARDRTVRLWRVVEETQLVFRGGGLPKAEKRRKETESAAINGFRSSNIRIHKLSEAAKYYEAAETSSFAEGSIDRCAFIDDETFITGSDSGALSLWSIHKKKPVFVLPLAHGVDRALKPEEAFSEENPVRFADQVYGKRKVPVGPQPRWITALRAIPYSDLIVTGSWDGNIRVWKVDKDKKHIEAVTAVCTEQPSQTLPGQPLVEQSHPVPGSVSNDRNGANCFGFEMANGVTGPIESNGREEHVRPVAPGVVNDISILERGERGQDGICIVAALSQEHRLGRWRKHKIRNGAVVFEIGKR